ncbi:hypothetical protein K432DRAFT_393367 [Lepidopterella palustris CBS 459.81]|uniref:Hypervirulence associated protein TUDOR domain-containing protein n=1 Tax=Lepidopterella palustris CBS 459.81 TaxID=1314670 RepID=A0A8E2E9P3_9PEZI|nr:hypothetical protein K432DRAFT_393367 [Lepidopterella palustris CBS 459.81]
MADKEVKDGDQVSWQSGSGRPSGEVAEVKDHGDLSIQSNNGNTVEKNADPEDPAVHAAPEGDNVVKRVDELTVEEKANGADAKELEKQREENAVPEEAGSEGEQPNGVDEPIREVTEEMKNGDAKADVVKNGDAKAEQPKTGEKRKAEEPTAKEDEPAKKKKTDKTETEKKAKGRGRPKKGEAAAGEKEKKAPVKKRQPKKAATADGEPRRSGRNKT